MDIEEAMGKLTLPIQKKMVAIGFLIEAEAKRNCPVDLGRLRASITINWSRSGMELGSAQSFFVGTQEYQLHGDAVKEPKAGPNEFVVVVGSGVSYSAFVELGTGIYAEGGLGRQTPWVYPTQDGKFVWTNGMRPVAYLRRAFEKYRSAILRLGAK